MDTKRWESVKDLLHQALQLIPAERAAYLDEACSSDASLRAEVESLLAAEEDVRTSFMQAPPVAKEHIAAGLLGTEPGGGLEAGQIIAQRYQLVRKLGEGGMGQVWLADQTSPVRRQIALKLIKAGMYDQAVVQRFQAERQSLAIMEHPAIAKVFDAGATEQGQPYFAMEYVPGLPITDYCDQKKLTIRQRLELFIQACEGVQHAHQKAIIHRDLKPPNILVVEVDGKPVPRIIDFGLAKAARPQADGETLFTQLGSFVGTPGYMSPEQADPSTHDVDTRTDVYSLGVVLYVLLTGVLPIDTKQWQKQPLEVLQRLREEEPEPPSTKVSVDREGLSVTAAARSTEPVHLVSLLRGDLDWITMKALEKDRTRRYGTPSELAADIQHYLKHEPVSARPASAVYRAKKYVRRHRFAVAAAAVLVLLLAGFGVLQTIELRRITRERDRANRERDRGTRITDFMTAMFKVSDPSESRGNTVTAREILDKSAGSINSGLAKDPEVQSQMADVIGRVYDNLGLYAPAEGLLTQALATERRVFGPASPETLRSMDELARVSFHRAHFPQAEALARQALDMQSRVLGPDHPDTLLSMNVLGATLAREGRFSESEKLLRGAFEGRYRALGPEDPETLLSMSDLAAILRDEGKLAEAEKLFREAAEVKRRVLRPDDPDLLFTLHNLATVLNDEGRYDEAERTYQETLEARRRVLGPEHPQTLLTMITLADPLTKMGHYEEAEKILSDALAIEKRVLGLQHPYTALTTYNLACVAAHRGHTDDALALLREAVDHGLPISVARNVDQDPDLRSLHGNPSFDAIVADAKQRVAAAQKPQGK